MKPATVTSAGAECRAAGHCTPIALLLAAFVALLPLLFWKPLYHPSLLPRELLIIIAGGLGGVLLAQGSRCGVTWPRHGALLLAFAVLAGVSLNWSLDFGHSATALLVLAGCLLLALSAAQIARAPQAQEPIFAALFASASLAAGIGLLQHFGWEPFQLHQSAPPASTFNNRNYAVAFLGPLVPLALFWTLRLRRDQTALLWLSALTAGLCLSYVIATSNRGMALALGITALVTAVALLRRTRLRALCRARARQRKAPLLTAIALVLLTVGLDDGSHRVQQFLQGELDGSARARLHAYINALPAIAERPLLGAGYGAFRAGFAPFVAAHAPVEVVHEYTAFAELHSDPLQYFIELGVPGGVLVCAIFVLALRSAWRASRRGRAESRLVDGAIGLALLTLGLHAWVDFPLQLPSSAALFWILLGLALGLDAGARRVRTSSASVRLLLTVGLLAYLALGTLVYQRYLVADMLQATAERAARTDRCDAAKQAATRSIDTFPYAYGVRFTYLRVYAVCGDATERMLASSWAIATDPTIPLAYLVRGDVLLQEGRLEPAAANYTKAVELLPHRASGYLGLSAVAMQLGQVDAARTLLETALQVQPGSELARTRWQAFDALETGGDTGGDAESR